jgi:predicted RNA-binding Zn-ribbon protein involved in translation (DUF1610 family)
MVKIKDSEPCPCGSGKLFGECHGPRILARKSVDVSRVVNLNVIPEPDPDTRAVFEKIGAGSVVLHSHETSVAHCCGNCGSHLAEGIDISRFSNIVIKCNHCGSFNELL